MEEGTDGGVGRDTTGEKEGAWVVDVNSTEGFIYKKISDGGFNGGGDVGWLKVFWVLSDKAVDGGFEAGKTPIEGWVVGKRVGKRIDR